MVPSFYSRELFPFKQAEKQLDALLGRIDRTYKLKKKVPARIIVACECYFSDESAAHLG
jgi:hypothetical protein